MYIFSHILLDTLQQQICKSAAKPGMHLKVQPTNRIHHILDPPNACKESELEGFEIVYEKCTAKQSTFTCR